MNGVISQSTSAPFQTWRSRSRVFLAARNGSAWFVCDDAGTYYGSWQDIGTFRRRHTDGDSSLAIGTGVMVSVRGAP